MHHDEISKIVTFANICIWSVLFLITFAFVKISLKDVPLGEALSNANPQHVQSVLLSIYVTCWGVGCTLDTIFQSWVYLVDPLGGRVRLSSIIPVAAIGIIAVIVLLVRDNELWFSEAFLGFTTVDIGAWLYLRYFFLPPIIEATYKNLKNPPPDYYGQVLLRAVTSQIIGNWKWIRQIFLYVFVLLMLLVALSPSSRDVASKAAAALATALTGSDIAPTAMDPLIQVLLLAAFIFISEVWHFALRARTFLIKRLISEMERDYDIRPKSVR